MILSPGFRTAGRGCAALMLAFALSACGGGDRAPVESFVQPGGAARVDAAHNAELNRLIRQYSREYDVPETLVHRVVKRESSYNPAARNGPYFGLMQILPQTARTMGHDGDAAELLDARTNLKYGVRYLRGAWMVSKGDPDAAVGWYSRGYYYEAKRLGLLKETGLRG